MKTMMICIQDGDGELQELTLDVDIHFKVRPDDKGLVSVADDVKRFVLGGEFTRQMNVAALYGDAANKLLMYAEEDVLSDVEENIESILALIDETRDMTENVNVESLMDKLEKKIRKRDVF